MNVFYKLSFCLFVVSCIGTDMSFLECCGHRFVKSTFISGINTGAR